MDQALIAYFDERFREAAREITQQVTQQVQGLREEMNRQFGEVRETSRLTFVLVEDLRDDLHLVAEAFMGLSQRVERIEDRAALSFETVRGWPDVKESLLKMVARYRSQPTPSL